MHASETIEKYQSDLCKKLEINPHDQDALIYLGALEFECFREDEKAISLLERAIQCGPTNIPAKFWLAMCLFYDYFEYAKAEEILMEALQLDPNRPECLSLIAWIISENKGPINEAIEYVQKALIFAPDWPMLRYQLGGFFVDIGDVEAAEREVQKAFQIPELNQKKITNDVQRYYESVVTGRSWSDAEKKSSYLVERIQKAKRLL